MPLMEKDAFRQMAEKPMRGMTDFHGNSQNCAGNSAAISGLRARAATFRILLCAKEWRWPESPGLAVPSSQLLITPAFHAVDCDHRAFPSKFLESLMEKLRMIRSDIAI